MSEERGTAAEHLDGEWGGWYPDTNLDYAVSLVSEYETFPASDLYGVFNSGSLYDFIMMVLLVRLLARLRYLLDCVNVSKYHCQRVMRGTYVHPS